VELHDDHHQAPRYHLVVLPVREWGAPVALVLAWTVAVSIVASGFSEIRESDIPFFIARAARFPHVSFVDGFYPWGCPAQLRLVATVIGNYQRAGQKLAIVGGTMTIASVRITARVGFDWFTALASTTLLVTLLPLWTQTLHGGTDMPAIGWTYASLAMLTVHVRRPHLAWTTAAGGLLGLGYLVRYSVLPLALVYPLELLLAPIGERRARYALAFTGAFLIAAAPQLVMTAQEHWNPFWNRQDVNVISACSEDSGGWRTETRWPLVVVVLTAVTLALATSLAFVNQRLVLPIVPALAVVAGHGLARIRATAFWLVIVAVAGFRSTETCRSFRSGARPAISRKSQRRCTPPGCVMLHMS
jgi:hypothetical protein